MHLWRFAAASNTDCWKRKHVNTDKNNEAACSAETGQHLNIKLKNLTGFPEKKKIADEIHEV